VVGLAVVVLAAYRWLGLGYGLSALNQAGASSNHTSHRKQANEALAEADEG